MESKIVEPFWWIWGGSWVGKSSQDRTREGGSSLKEHQLRGVIGLVVLSRVTRPSWREVAMLLEPRWLLQDAKKTGFRDRNSSL